MLPGSPRAGGDETHPASPFYSPLGDHPRARGTRSEILDDLLRRMRITPARGDETNRTDTECAFMTDHPRAQGCCLAFEPRRITPARGDETSCCHPVCTAQTGPPPRTGMITRLPDRPIDANLPRITPACGDQALLRITPPAGTRPKVCVGNRIVLGITPARGDETRAHP
jgi:hypothetical protein